MILYTEVLKPEFAVGFRNKTFGGYVGFEEDLKTLFPDTDETTTELANPVVFIEILKSKDTHPATLKMQEGCHRIIEHARQAGADMSILNEWFKYEKNIKLKIECDECCYINLCDGQGTFDAYCGNNDCDATLHNEDTNPAYRDHNSLSRVEGDRVANDLLQKFETKQTSEITPELIERLAGGEVISGEEFKSLDNDPILKQMYLKRLKDMQIQEMAMAYQDKAIQAQIPAKDRLIKEDIVVDNEGEIKKFSEYYLKEVVYMSSMTTWGVVGDRDKFWKKLELDYPDLFVDVDLEPFDAIRSLLHTHLSKLTGLSEGDIGKATSALGSAIGLPSTKLMMGNFNIKQIDNIIMVYGLKFFKWIKTQMDLKKIH